MKKLRLWLASESGKRFFNIAYSLGAAIVIIGAMGKVMHYSWSSAVFVTGMIVEAFIFIISAFDTSLYDNTPVTVGSNIQMSDNLMVNNSSETQTIQTAKSQTTAATSSNGSGGSQVIIVGGTSSGTEVPSAGVTGATGNIGNNQTQGSIIAGGGVGGGFSAANVPSQESVKGYSESMANAAQNMEEFSKTMQSLNDTSQALLNAYKQIADANSLSESMNTVRYINDSLARIKNLYDGAIGDSYMFKEEMSKMTRHIEALNQVYARLLQAMTSNNPNQNNPPIY